jgi:hypothetical protein
MEQVWGDANESFDRTVDTHIKTLRAKLRAVNPDISPINTHRGMGYSLGLLMRIGMRLLLGYFLIVAIAAWFVLSIFVQESKPGVRRATEGTLIDTATLLAELAREDLLSADPQQGGWRRLFKRCIAADQRQHWRH